MLAMAILSESIYRPIKASGKFMCDISFHKFCTEAYSRLGYKMSYCTVLIEGIS